MATQSFKSLCIFLILSSLCISICGDSSSSRRKVLSFVTKQDDSTPITNPANFPTYSPTPTVVTIPGASPTTVTPTNPVPTPITTVPTSPTPTTPITNPATPVTNPATTYPSPTTTTPTPGTNVPVGGAPGQASGAPITPGQTWCVAQPGAPESSLQSALDYACGIGGADCSTIQQGASCYNPNSLENHASYAFNSYFQKNPVATSCDFGGAAMLVNTNPSVGSCIFPSSATGNSTPASTNPPATTSSSNGATGSPLAGGTTTGSPYQVPAAGSYGSPPSYMNTSNPASVFPASYGPDSPPTGNYPAGTAVLQPCISTIILVASLSTGRLIFGS